MSRPAVAPKPISSGDVVRIVAPSGPFDHQLYHRAVRFLSDRYRIRSHPSILGQTGYLAGSDQLRRDGLRDALLDREATAIICVRGGYGIDRIVDQLPWDRFAAYPKWLVGFSDVTALHLEVNRRGVMSVHGPNLLSLASASSQERWRWINALEEPKRARCHPLEGWCDGHACGPLVGGNLTVLFAAAAAGRLRLPPAAVLLLEDVTEMPYRIDRMLTTLRRGGHMEGIGGVVLGEFTRCSAGRDGVTAMVVLRERLERWGCPVASGLPVGHGDINESIVLGGRCRLTVTGSQGELISGLSVPPLRSQELTSP